ncbi:uncharacterized protein LOC135197438 [Macrobrachium nipponense]|uniref:uncharacterized protein LOC135197438 n=1 Tax=Macrobrachium nipponense TaxID=159736 RepID=UPI0030C7AE90
MLTETVKWRWSKWVLLWMTFQYLSFAQANDGGDDIPLVAQHSRRGGTVRETEGGAEGGPDGHLRVDVRHRGPRLDTSTSGTSLLSPIHSQHKLTVQHIVDDATVHILKVLLDGAEVEFVQSQNYDWTDFYQFHHIALSLRGTADISPCEHPTTHHPHLRPTPPSTPAPAPPPSTTRGTREPPTFFPYGPPEDGKTTVWHFEEQTTTPPSGETPDEDDDVIYLSEPYDPTEEPAYTDLSRNETYDDGESDSDVKESDDANDDDEPWWRRFVYILGDYKRIPLLLIFLIVFCVGAGMGSVATIICEQYCCCRDDHSNKSSDYDGDEFRHFSRQDFMRPAANATFVGTVDSSGRVAKENISHPLPASGSRSPGSETYHTPYQQQQRERYLSNSTDETLPLNMPLPQDNQRVKNGNYSQFNKYQDTYQ